MNITNPVVSYLLALVVYGVPAPTERGTLAGLVLAGLLIAFGVAGLARRLPGHHPVAAPSPIGSPSGEA
jgi:hypothetical protein